MKLIYSNIYQYINKIKNDSCSSMSPSACARMIHDYDKYEILNLLKAIKAKPIKGSDEMYLKTDFINAFEAEKDRLEASVEKAALQYNEINDVASDRREKAVTRKNLIARKYFEYTQKQEAAKMQEIMKDVG